MFVITSLLGSFASFINARAALDAPAACLRAASDWARSPAWDEIKLTRRRITCLKLLLLNDLQKSKYQITYK